MVALSSPDTSLQHQATHDALTGLLNRNAFSAELDRLISQTPGQFGLLAIDLNDLKKVNDSEGHASGDDFLVRTANVITFSLRQEDDDRESDLLAVGRVGGDEFLALLPGVDSEDNLNRVEKRLRDNFARADISASVGGQVHYLDMSDSMLLANADAKMYLDKDRQRLERYTPSQLEIIKNIGSVVSEHEIDPRDIAGILATAERKD